MSNVDKDKPMNSSDEEINRHLHEIFSRVDDPEFLEKQRIERSRENRLDKSDLSL